MSNNKKAKPPTVMTQLLTRLSNSHRLMKLERERHASEIAILREQITTLNSRNEKLAAASPQNNNNLNAELRRQDETIVRLKRLVVEKDALLNEALLVRQAQDLRLEDLQDNVGEEEEEEEQDPQLQFYRYPLRPIKQQQHSPQQYMQQQPLPLITQPPAPTEILSTMAMESQPFSPSNYLNLPVFEVPISPPQQPQQMPSISQQIGELNITSASVPPSALFHDVSNTNQWSLNEAGILDSPLVGVEINFDGFQSGSGDDWTVLSTSNDDAAQKEAPFGDM